MTVSTKVPKYILQRVNEGADVESLARSKNQGTLMHSHDRQQINMQLRHADSRVL